LARDYATLWGSAGEYLGRVWYFRDITARRNEEEKVAFTDLVLKTQMEASLDGILVVDQTKTIVSFNRRIADIWNIPLADLAAGADDPVLKTVAASVKDPLSFVARVKYLYDHPGEDSQEEVETLDGRSLDRHSVTLWGPLQKYLGRAWFFRDITDRKRSEALELRMARFDVLTGLANRAVFVEALQQSIASAERGETGFAVLYLDLDRFKDVNDTLGHPAGDELLQAVADRLRARTRIADTVARFGGDEFAMIVSGIRDPTDAAILADKLIEALAVPFSIQGSDIHSGASIGIAAYGLDTTDAETLLSHADLALYRAKAEGRGGYRFFTGAMDTEAHTRVTLGAELRVAIDAGQLFLLYQPQVEIASGRITGLEALVRWRHPTRGILAPCLFVPVAEQMGIIAKLGHWVLLEACRQGKAWLDEGIPPVRLSVNVSALQFRASIALEADIAATLTQTGFPARLLELELTESVLMAASLEHGDFLERLRLRGVTVAIDDFGTGHSSLEYLRRFPSNRIKIARSFVTNLDNTPGDAAIVRATIGLARELEIDVIAEGVETQEQCDLLKKWGCGEVQGFHFARPLPTDGAANLLRAGKIPLMTNQLPPADGSNGTEPRARGSG
jgi:diguanylate cyclase (GGDEF)-like protein